MSHRSRDGELIFARGREPQRLSIVRLIASGAGFETYTWDWDIDPVTGMGWLGALRELR